MIKQLPLRVEFDSNGGTSAMFPVLAYLAVRMLAKLISALAPIGAFISLLSALVWLAAAVYLFVVLTWFREDNWLGAGVIMASTFFCGGLLGDTIVRIVQTASVGDAVYAIASMMVTMLIRAIILIPLSGGAVFGARWLTAEARSSGALSS
jgi:hypothetical protein